MKVTVNLRMTKSWDNIAHLEDSIAVKTAYPTKLDRASPLKSVLTETVMDLKDLLRAAERAGIQLIYTEREEEDKPTKKRVRLPEPKKRRTRL